MAIALRIEWRNRGQDLNCVVEHSSQIPYDALLRLDQPGPGVCALGAIHCSSPILVALNFDQAAATVARETPLWQAWIQDRFPMPTYPSK